MVRGKPVGLALNTLRFTPKKGAELVRKVLESAIANAENNLSADVDELKVQTITVDAAPVLKRFHARAKGRGTESGSATVTSHHGRRREEGRLEARAAGGRLSYSPSPSLSQQSE